VVAHRRQQVGEDVGVVPGERLEEQPTDHFLARSVSALYVPRITDDAALAPSGWFAPTA